MRIICSQCNQAFESLIIVPELAFKQISDKVLDHCRRKHKDKVDEIGKILQASTMALMQYISLESFADIPETEKWLIDQKAKSLEIVMRSIGFVPDTNKEEINRDQNRDQTKTITLEKIDLITNQMGLFDPAD